MPKPARKPFGPSLSKPARKPFGLSLSKPARKPFGLSLSKPSRPLKPDAAPGTFPSTSTA